MTPSTIYAGNIQGLHNLHGNFNVPNMPGALGSRSTTMNNIASSGLQQASGNLSTGRFASNNLPVGLSQVQFLLQSCIMLENLVYILKYVKLIMLMWIETLKSFSCRTFTRCMFGALCQLNCLLLISFYLQISHSNAHVHSGMANRGGMSVIGNQGYSSSSNGVGGSIPGILPTSAAIGNRTSVPGLGVSPVLGNTGQRLTTSMGSVVGGGNIGRNISSGGGLSVPGLGSRLNFSANSGSGNLNVQGQNRMMSGVLQQGNMSCNNSSLLLRHLPIFYVDVIIVLIPCY